MGHNLIERLKAALSTEEWELLQRITGAADTLHLPLYLVGGLPRDLILGKPIRDFDLVVEGRAEVLAKQLASTYGGKVIVHGKFGTAKWDLKGSSVDRRTSEGPWRSIDFVTARSETYKHPAALPSVEPGTIDDDLRRRDFTINALAIRLDELHAGEVRDDCGGWDDIETGIVRVLHDRSFIDDPTRVFRAVRYAQRYGFRISDQTLALVPAARRVVERLSAQRTRHELDLILEEPRAAEMLRQLAALRLLAAVHPVLSFDEEAERRVTGLERNAPLAVPHWPIHELRWICWLIRLPEDELKSLERRLHFGAAQFRALVAASELWMEADSLVDLTPSRWVERLDQAPLMAVYAVYLAAPTGSMRTPAERYLTQWRHVRPKTTGHELKSLGIEPGAEYKRILSALRRARLDGEVKSEQEEGQYLRGLLRKEETK